MYSPKNVYRERIDFSKIKTTVPIPNLILRANRRNVTNLKLLSGFDCLEKKQPLRWLVCG
jgi:hypothetical protein